MGMGPATGTCYRLNNRLRLVFLRVQVGGARFQGNYLGRGLYVLPDPTIGDPDYSSPRR